MYWKRYFLKLNILLYTECSKNRKTIIGVVTTV